MYYIKTIRYNSRPPPPIPANVPINPEYNAIANLRYEKYCRVLYSYIFNVYLFQS